MSVPISARILRAAVASTLGMLLSGSICGVGGDEFPDQQIQFRNLMIHEVNDLQGEHHKPGMMGGELALQGQLTRRGFPLQPPPGEQGKQVGIPFPGH
jgi:hypothetical protein